VQIFINIFTGLVVLISAILIVLVMLQTPKNEGFGGATNAPGGNFRGKAGMDEMLSNYTRFVAFGWFASAFILAILNEVGKR